MTGLPKLLTEPEVAEILHCSPYTVARLRKAGKLPYIPGRPVLIHETDLLALVGNSPLLTEEQAAERLSLKPSQLRWWRDTGRIGSCPIRRAMYREEDIQAYFAAQEAERARKAANLIAIREWYAEQERRKAERQRQKTEERKPKARRRAVVRIPVLKRSHHGVWYIHWCEARRTKRVSTRTRVEREANAVFRRWRKDKGL
jgi:hypothetical protein